MTTSKSLRFFAVNLIVCTSFAAISTNSIAGKVYKWVDEDGQVHFSQTPPPKSEASKATNVKELLVKSSTLAVDRRGDYYYCGSMQLPGPIYEPRNMAKKIPETLQEWRSKLNELRSQHHEEYQRKQENVERIRDSDVRYSRNVVKNNNESYLVENMNQLQCAIDWAERTMQENQFVDNDLIYEYETAKRSYKQAVSEAKNRCGDEPIDYYKTRDYETKSQYENCMSDYRYKISAARRILDRARQSQDSAY